MLALSTTLLALQLGAASPAAPAKPATPAPQPAPVVRELLRATALVEPTITDDARKGALAELRRTLKATAGQDAPAPTALVAHAWKILDLAPDHEEAHALTVRALIEARVGHADSTLAAALEARAARFVARAPFSSRGHELLAEVRLAHGDEEGQLRALAACGDACRPRLLAAARAWQRERCSAGGLADNVVLRMDGVFIADVNDLEFVELDPLGATSDPPGTACFASLTPEAAARLATLTAGSSARTPTTLLVLTGIVHAGEAALVAPPDPRALRLPQAACARICVAPEPRPLPSEVTLSAKSKR